MSTHYTQYAVALWEPHVEKLSEKYSEFMGTATKQIRHCTSDEAYWIYLWEFVSCETIDCSDFLKDVSEIRHSIVSISDDCDYNPIHLDFKSCDNEGTDEEFDYLLSWNAYVHFEPYDIDFK